MADVTATLTTVWDPANVALALVAGLLLGFTVLGYLTLLPTYVSEATGGQVFLGVLAGALLSGAVFYVGQLLVEDEAYARLVSRFGLWCLYSFTMALGTWARIEWSLWRRRRRVVAAASAEVEESARGH